MKVRTKNTTTHLANQTANMTSHRLLTKIHLVLPRRLVRLRERVVLRTVRGMEMTLRMAKLRLPTRNILPPPRLLNHHMAETTRLTAKMARLMARRSTLRVITGLTRVAKMLEHMRAASHSTRVENMADLLRKASQSMREKSMAKLQRERSRSVQAPSTVNRS